MSNLRNPQVFSRLNIVICTFLDLNQEPGALCGAILIDYTQCPPAFRNIKLPEKEGALTVHESGCAVRQREGGKIIRDTSANGFQVSLLQCPQAGKKQLTLLPRPLHHHIHLFLRQHAVHQGFAGFHLTLNIYAHLMVAQGTGHKMGSVRNTEMNLGMLHKRGLTMPARQIVLVAFPQPSPLQEFVKYQCRSQAQGLSLGKFIAQGFLLPFGRNGRQVLPERLLIQQWLHVGHHHLTSFKFKFHTNPMSLPKGGVFMTSFHSHRPLLPASCHPS